VAAFVAVAGWSQFVMLRTGPDGQSERARLLEVHRSSEERWELMAREIARRVPPDTKVALAPIGAFKWVSRLYVVDMLGLTNEHIARAAPDPRIKIKGHTRSDADWVLAQEPAMIIVGNGWVHTDADGSRTLVASAWEKSLIEHGHFQRDYAPLVLAIEGSYPLIFYWRVGLPRPRGATDV
jgi:hypothetical protein